MEEEKKEQKPIEVVIRMEDDFLSIRAMVKALGEMQKECGCNITVYAKLLTRF